MRPNSACPSNAITSPRVWRGENTQRGRYREFMQCDFDTIGTKSVVADIETALVIHDLMLAIGFAEFTICINNRMVLNGLLEKLGLADQSTAVLRALDKLTKIGAENVIAEMQQQAGATREQAAEVLRLGELEAEPPTTILQQLDPCWPAATKGAAGVENLRQMIAGVRAAGVPASRMRLDVSIARGLDYYTGTIFETYLGRLPTIGSVCSGGRYDNLAGLFTKQELPGIGASLGLDRLLAAMEELGMIEKVATPAQVLLTYFAQDQLAGLPATGRPTARLPDCVSSCIRSPSGWANSSSTPISAASAWPWWPAMMSWRGGRARSRIFAPGESQEVSWTRRPNRSPRAVRRD